MPEKTEIKVFEIDLQVYLLKDIEAKDEFSKIAAFIDNGMAQEPDLLEFHRENRYKNYCWNLLYPIEREGLYRKGKLYHFQIRTIDHNLARYFHERLVNCFSEEIKGLTADIKIIPRKHISRIYSLTPVILKDSENGYWKIQLPLSIFEKRLKENILKKYQSFTGEKMDEDFLFYNTIEFQNRKPVPFKYKNITLLGDKIELRIDDNETAQQLAYLCLGTGVLEMNSRGAGYMQYQYTTGRR